jgi:hypothetical protein
VRISSTSKDQLRSSIVPWTDIRDVDLSNNQSFSWPKITYFQPMVVSHEQVWWFNISMTDTKWVQVSEASEHLIRIHFDQKWRHLFLLRGAFLWNLLYSFRHVLHHNIHVVFIFLNRIELGCLLNTYLLSRSEEAMSEWDYVRMVQFFHDSELSVLIALVLVYFLNCHFFIILSHSCLKEFY